MRLLRPLFILLLATSITVLAGNRYVGAGFPDPDHTWTIADYHAAASALKARKLPVPLFTDNEGSAILTRMVDLENLRHLSDETIPIENRSKYSSEVSNFVNNNLWPEYAATVEKGENPHQEMARIQCFSIRNAVYFQSLIRRELSEAADNPSLSKRLREITQKATRATLDKLIPDLVIPKYNLAIQMLGNNARFTAADHALILETLKETLPQITPFLSAADRKAMKEKLAQLRTTGTLASNPELAACITIFKS